MFTGSQTGHAIALDSSTGEELWRFKLGGGIRNQPVAYQLGGPPALEYRPQVRGAWRSLCVVWTKRLTIRRCKFSSQLLIQLVRQQGL